MICGIALLLINHRELPVNFALEFVFFVKEVAAPGKLIYVQIHALAFTKIKESYTTTLSDAARSYTKLLSKTALRLYASVLHFFGICVRTADVLLADFVRKRTKIIC